MRKLILATGCDDRYIKNIEPYLKSIEKNSNFDLNLFILLSNTKYEYQSNNIKTLMMLPNKFKYKTKINCLQHGEFLDSEMFDDFVKDDDVIFYTDGDIILQRSLNTSEYEWFKNINHDEVMIGYNASIDDNLKLEFDRLSPQKNLSFELMNDFSKIKCYNTGVMGMTKKTWRKLLMFYGPLFPKINQTLQHYAKQQWLICFVFGTQGFKITELNYDIHNHKHYVSPMGTELRDDKMVYYNNKLVLFRHAWEKNHSI